MHLWRGVVLILLFAGATQAARTGQIFQNLQQLSLLVYFHLNRFIFKSLLFSFLIKVYTFESASHLSSFTASSTSTLELTTARYKDATHSMKWTWASADTITHSFTSDVSIFFFDIKCQLFNILDFLQSVSSRCKNGSLCLLIYHGWFKQVGKPELVLANLCADQKHQQSLDFFIFNQFIALALANNKN